MNAEAMIVSVVIPARNEAELLPSCLESLRGVAAGAAQIEVIVVDNGSQDATAKIARNLGATVLDSPAGTIARARNEGARVANGDVVVFLDADCTVEPGWLVSALRHFENPEVVAVGAYPAAPASGNWLQRSWSFLVQQPLDKPRRVAWLGSSNLFVARPAFDRVDGFDPTLVTCEDADLCYRLRSHGAIVSDASVRAIHHREPRSLRAFFSKELWHGRDSFNGFFGGRWTAAELPSLLAPAAYALAFASALASGVWWVAQGRGLALLICGLAVLALTPFAYALRAVLTKGRWLQLPRFILIYGVYFSARAAALVGKLGRMMRAVFH